MSVEWREEDGKLRGEVTKRDFAEAMAFVNRVADAAEAMDHHPDICISWNKVRLELWTHTSGSVSDKDRQLAARIDELVD